jgi:hypothetical protein
VNNLRLNDKDFKSDIMSFLALSYGARGSYEEVEDWIREYDIQIEKNIEQLLINIFGCGIEELRKDYFDQIEEINNKLYNNGYTFLINKKSINVTINYYPEETKELIKMGTLTEEKVSKFSNLCLEKLNNQEHE